MVFSQAVIHGFFFMGECSRSMRWVCGVASMLKCDFNKVAMQLCWVTLRRGCSPANLVHILRAPLFGSSYGGILLSFAKELLFFSVDFRVKFTYCYHNFLIFCNSSYISVSYVYNLVLCFFDNRLCSKQTLSWSFGMRIKKRLKQEKWWVVWVFSYSLEAAT